MKNRLYILITILFAAFVCFSCKSEVDKAGKAGAEKQKISINVKFPSLEKNILEDRKAFLTDDELDEIIGSYSFTLTAKRNAASEAETLSSALSYEELRDFSDEILTGSWIFTLLAYSRETRELCLSGTDTATISSENVSLNFEMQYVEDAAGVFEFKIPIEKYTDEEDFSYGYHKIVVKSFASPNQDYLVFPNGANKEKVSTAVDVNSEGTGESYSCTYSITLGVGKYMVFIYEPMSHTGLTVNDYYAYPKQNELAYIYGGVTTEKDYSNLLANTVQDVDVELYVGRGLEDALADLTVVGSSDHQLNFPTIEYDYNNETGWITYKNSQQKDLLLPKLTLEDKYLIGWYTDEECTQKADYVNYNKCNDTTDLLNSVVYFWYDIAKVSGKLKLYAKFAPKYDILVDTDGGTLNCSTEGNYIESVEDPVEGSSVYTLKNCAFEYIINIYNFKASKIGVDGSATAVFIGWYLDEAHTTKATGAINKDFTGKDSDGNPLKLYAYFIDNDATMDVKIMDGETDITSSITQNSYSNYIQMNTSGRFSVSIQESATPPAKDGYAFTGWYSDPDFENPLTYKSTYREYSYNFEGLDKFIPGGTIYIYAKYEPLVSPSLNISVQSYEENDLELTYTENNGVLTVTASPITTGTTYESYTWLVNGSILPEENSNTLNYTLYTNEGGSQTPVYTSGSTIFISCIAKRDSDNDDRDDASLELLLDINAELEVSYEGTEDVDELIFQIQYCKGSSISDGAKKITDLAYDDFASGIPIEGLSAGEWTFRITGKRQTDEWDEELQDYLYEDVIQGTETEQLDYGKNNIRIELN
ncbi:MAG: InlB B-repeat-containing protein [Treponema sp.]|nr:InlB B-repeat-containing protein [Treponema sp.]